MKYILYATSEKGDGHVMQVGEYDSPEDIVIHVDMFAKDVVLNVSIEKEKDE